MTTAPTPRPDGVTYHLYLWRPDNGQPVRVLESGQDPDGTPWYKLHPDDAEAVFGKPGEYEGEAKEVAKAWSEALGKAEDWNVDLHRKAQSPA